MSPGREGRGCWGNRARGKSILLLVKHYGFSHGPTSPLGQALRKPKEHCPEGFTVHAEVGFAATSGCTWV